MPRGIFNLFKPVLRHLVEKELSFLCFVPGYKIDALIEVAACSLMSCIRIKVHHLTRGNGKFNVNEMSLQSLLFWHITLCPDKLSGLVDTVTFRERAVACGAKYFTLSFEDNTLGCCVGKWDGVVNLQESTAHQGNDFANTGGIFQPNWTWTQTGQT